MVKYIQKLISSNFEFKLVMHKIDFYNPICIMKILPVRKRLSKPLALGRPQPPFKVAVSQRFTATFASRQGNYRFRLANVFDSLFLSSRIFIIKQFFAKSILCLIFKKLEFRAKLHFFQF